ncbi:MAG: hypothetical protein LC672_02425, partial [Acidobacteria bacterium]|nr:hypothetical protein [Acidobacteriota bacterium]
DRAADAMDTNIDSARETQQHAISDLYILATLTAHGPTLDGQITRCLLQNDFVAIQLGAAAPRSLDLDDCRIAINSHDVNAAANRGHVNTRFSREDEASIDFIPLSINCRPNG